MIKIIPRSQTVLFRILIDFGTVFSEIKALKSFSCLKSSLTDAAENEIRKKLKTAINK